ncbi:TSSK6-activating co-chaperone protein isoform X1 [Lutra lutra]|uniref:TSSK6-activating co-chaperone protein isoform X1 n=1 Tax=Lutra lutra TaxID=9657 RepID=UPI001FD38933|nr:TSSK6-activating co-chaperone protein isoform X1 [Lutra lutra]
MCVNYEGGCRAGGFRVTAQAPHLLVSRWSSVLAIPAEKAFLLGLSGLHSFTMSKIIADPKKASCLDSRIRMCTAPPAPRAYAWISHMATEDEIPWLACVGSQALSSWGARPGAVPTRMAWNLRRVIFPEEVLLTKPN